MISVLPQLWALWSVLTKTGTQNTLSFLSLTGYSKERSLSSWKIPTLALYTCDRTECSLLGRGLQLYPITYAFQISMSQWVELLTCTLKSHNKQRREPESDMDKTIPRPCCNHSMKLHSQSGVQMHFLASFSTAVKQLDSCPCNAELV